MKKMTKQHNYQQLGYWDEESNAPLHFHDLTTKQIGAVDFWWICSEGHRWKGRYLGHEPVCPQCEHIDRSLLKTHPELAAEWHPTKNGKLKPVDVRSSSRQSVWWQCKNYHEWQTQVKSRSNRSAACPYCKGKKASKENNLQVINPSLAAEWHPSKNLNLTPQNVTPKSPKKVWWLCQNKRHEWRTSVLSRAYGNNCPYCSSRKLCIDNCLQATNPLLAKRWHPTKNDDLTPYDVMANSNKKVWWLCENKGHEFQAFIYDQNKNGGCPYCQCRKVCTDNCLSTQNPELAKQWHPSKNGSLKPDQVVSGSSVKVWWQCSKQHSWQAVIRHRNKGDGCPYCSGRYSEQDID